MLAGITAIVSENRLRSDYRTYSTFLPSPDAYWDGTHLLQTNPVTFGPNPDPVALSPLCVIVRPRNLFHSIARTHLVGKEYRIDRATTYRYRVIGQNLIPDSRAARDAASTPPPLGRGRERRELDERSVK